MPSFRTVIDLVRQWILFVNIGDELVFSVAEAIKNQHPNRRIVNTPNVMLDAVDIWKKNGHFDNLWIARHKKDTLNHVCSICVWTNSVENHPKNKYVRGSKNISGGGGLRFFLVLMGLIQTLCKC